jgi:tetratricopeptide (TPR) repeat protein
MIRLKRTPAWALLGFAVMLGLCLVAPARADDDTAKLKDAAKALNQITGEEVQAKKVKELTKDAEGTKKLLAVAADMVKEKKDAFNSNATLILAQAAHGVKDYANAEQFYRLNVEQVSKIGGAKLAQAYAGLISLLYDTKKFAETEKVCREFLELEPDETLQRLRTAVDNQMIMAVVKQKDADRAFKMIDKRIKDNADSWRLIIFKARVQRELERYDDAVKTYGDATAKINQDDKLTKGEKEAFADDVQYALTGLYVDKNDIKTATDILEKLLEKDPDNPTYNNDLGFIWCDHDMKINESEKLIRKAIDEERKQRKANPDLRPEDDHDNSAYLDSLGWVLFKQKKFKEAKPFLVDALKDEDGQHVEIFDHLGEVQMALGEKKEAVETWKKGIEVAGPSKREQERKEMIEKKLKDLMK